MSVVYAYGFARPVERTGLVGVDGVRVGLFPRDNIALLGSELASEDAVDPWDGLVAHNRVLSAALEQGPVVPVQAGSCLPPAECERLLEQEYQRVDHLLTRFENRIEAKVQFTWHEHQAIAEIVAEQPELGRNGSDYHQSVRAGQEIVARLERKRQREGPGLMADLQPHSEAVALHEGSELTVLDASFLVARDSLPRFEETLGQLRDRHAARMEMKYIAPLPFYSFLEAH